MKSFQEFLTEAPLAEYDPSDAGERKTKTGKPILNKQGRPLSSFSPIDIKLIKNPKNQKKLEKVLAQFKQDFRFFFADFAGSNKFHEMGELKEEDVIKGDIGGYGVTAETSERMVKYLQQVGLVGENKKFTDKANKSISVIYTTNVGDAKVGLTPWIILHRMGHSMNRGNSSAHRATFIEHFVNNIKPEIYEFLTSNYTPDSDVYKSDAEYDRAKRNINEFLKHLMSKDTYGDKALAPIFEFFKIFGNFNTAKRTREKEEGKGKNTPAVVKEARAYEFLYESFVSFLWYAENSRNVWEDEEEEGKKKYPFIRKIPEKIKMNEIKLALSDKFVAEQAESYMKNMISNGIRGVDRMFESMVKKIDGKMIGKIFIM